MKEKQKEREGEIEKGLGLLILDTDVCKNNREFDKIFFWSQKRIEQQKIVTEKEEKKERKKAKE